MKLGFVVGFAFAITAILLSVGAALYWYDSSIKVVEKDVEDHLLTTAQSRADHIESFLIRLMTEVEIAATHSNLSEEELAEIRDLGENIHSLYILDSEGKTIVSSGETPCGKDLNEKEVFLKGKEGTVFINNYLCTTFDREMMAIATPFNKGVLVARIETEKHLREIVKDRTGLGETGEVLIAIQGEEGTPNFLFERLFESQVSQEIQIEKTAEPMKKALLGEELVFINSLDYRNEEVIAVSQYLKPVGIGLVAKIDKSEAFADQRSTLLRISLMTNMIIVLLSILIALFLSRFLARPLKKLSDDVDEITKGKIELSLEKSNIEEIQSLTDSLNRILASLKLAILRTGVSKSQIGIGSEEALKAKQKAEKDLKETRERLELAMKGTSDGLWDWDIIKNKVNYSEKWKSMLGYRPKEIKEDFKEFEIRIHPNDKKRVVSYVQKYVKSNGKLPFEIEFKMKHKKGHYVPILARAFLKLDEKRKPVRMVGTHIDLTERKKVQEKYKELFDSINEGVAVYKPVNNGKDFVFLNFNKAAEKIDKIKRNKLIGKKVTEVFPGVKKSGIFDKFVQAYKTGKPQKWTSEIYEDKRLGKTKRENYVYRLSSGEIVAVYRQVKIK